MIGAVVMAGAAGGAAQWRVLRLARATEPAWQGDPVVTSSSQDSDGWIDAEIDDSADGTAWVGFTVGPLGADVSTLVELRIEQDYGAWVDGSDVSAGLAVVDAAALSPAVANHIAGIAIDANTQRQIRAEVQEYGSPPYTGSIDVGAPFTAYGVVVALPGGAPVVVVAALDSGALGDAPLGGTQAAGVYAWSGQRRIVLLLQSRGSAGTGPHPVRLRASYRMSPPAHPIVG